MIRSVYDFDGVDKVAAETNGAVANIAALADPKQATANQRPARFVRIVKAVEIPDKKVRKINDSAISVRRAWACARFSPTRRWNRTVR